MGLAVLEVLQQVENLVEWLDYSGMDAIHFLLGRCSIGYIN